MKSGLRPKSYWGDECKRRLASQIDYIKHWCVICGSYDNIDNQEATWFIDPPYQKSCGRQYKFNEIDYTKLANWCRSRKGQVIVCEQEGADWLPFKPLTVAKGSSGRQKGSLYSREVVWVNN